MLIDGTDADDTFEVLKSSSAQSVSIRGYVRHNEAAQHYEDSSSTLCQHNRLKPRTHALPVFTARVYGRLSTIPVNTGRVHGCQKRKP